MAHDRVSDSKVERFRQLAELVARDHQTLEQDQEFADLLAEIDRVEDGIGTEIWRDIRNRARWS